MPLLLYAVMTAMPVVAGFRLRLKVMEKVKESGKSPLGGVERVPCGLRLSTLPERSHYLSTGS
jgi:hypothetical protein